MDANQTFRAEPEDPTEPLARAAQALFAESAETAGLRPRADDVLLERVSMRDTSVNLRKEELLRLLLAGKRTRQCADILGVSVYTVRKYVMCAEFQDMLWKADKKLWSRIDEEFRVSKLALVVRVQELSEQALERIADLMESEDEAIAFRASADILDRNPDTSKHSKTDNTNRNFTLDPTQLIAAAAAAAEMEVRRNERIVNGSANASSDTATESR